MVLFLFVAELRTSLIVVLSLPLTFLASFIVMGAAGLSSNLMSLGGLAFSVGMVVDDSSSWSKTFGATWRGGWTRRAATSWLRRWPRRRGQ